MSIVLTEFQVQGFRNNHNVISLPLDKAICEKK